MDNDFDNMNNDTLERNARSLHGSLYKRINTLQRDLNIARETIKNYERRFNEQKEIIKQLENNQTAPITVKVQQFPNEPELIYKLVRE